MHLHKKKKKNLIQPTLVKHKEITSWMSKENKGRNLQNDSPNLHSHNDH